MEEAGEHLDVQVSPDMLLQMLNMFSQQRFRKPTSLP